MSLESATTFFTDMMQDEDFLHLAAAATEGKDGPARTAALVSLGAGRGYDFTVDEANTIQDIIEDITALSDDDLDAVAGGTTSGDFENANQKSTQYVNMLSSVLKTMNEMQSGIIRNLR